MTSATPVATSQLVIAALGGVALLLYLIIGRRVHAFVALLLVSLLIGLAAQYPNFEPQIVLKAMQAGMGGTLGFVAVVVGLGAMFGKLLEASGGAFVLAQGLLDRVPRRFSGWALGAAGFLVSIPVFFDVGFVILLPLLHEVSRKTRVSLTQVATPLLAGMVVTHAFIPPTPGPMGVAAILGAQLGWVVLFGFMAGVPAMILAGPVFARHVSGQGNKVAPPLPTPELPVSGEGPSGVTVLALVLLPLALMLGGSVTSALLGPDDLAALSPRSPYRLLATVCALLGHPFVALLLTTLLCFHLLGTRGGMSKAKVNELASASLEPVGVVVLVTGAGGVLKQVMIDTHVGDALAHGILGWGVSLVLLSYLLAAIVRVMQGSATVAMLTSAGLLVPIIEASGPSDAQRALLVVAIAAGATGFSHVNDSGFWLVNRYLGLSVPETFRSWTALTTIVSVTGLAACSLISLFL